MNEFINDSNILWIVWGIGFVITFVQLFFDEKGDWNLDEEQMKNFFTYFFIALVESLFWPLYWGFILVCLGIAYYKSKQWKKNVE